MNPHPPQDWRLGVFFAIVFPVFWCCICYLLSVTGGWWRLARRFRAKTPVAGTTWWFRYAEMHYYAGCFYRHCLNVTANADGIGLSLPFLFRPGHPPLFIPWSEILVSRTRRFIFLNRVHFAFPEEPSVWLELSPRLASKIQVAIGQDWFPDLGS
jgi:hypothetical protein